MHCGYIFFFVQTISRTLGSIYHVGTRNFNSWKFKHFLAVYCPLTFHSTEEQIFIIYMQMLFYFWPFFFHPLANIRDSHKNNHLVKKNQKKVVCSSRLVWVKAWLSKQDSFGRSDVFEFSGSTTGFIQQNY